MGDGNFNFDGIAASAQGSILRLAQLWVPGGRMEGREYSMLNPNRPDSKTGSFKINTETGAWSDFACDAKGGDIISFCKYVNNCKDMMDAVKMVKEAVGMPDTDTKQKAKVKPGDEWEPVLIPADAPPPFQRHPKHGEPTLIHTYKDEADKVLGYIYRYDLGVKNKEFFPLSFCKNSQTGVMAWRWKALNKPRPIYGLETLSKHQAKEQVMIVQGEKKCDAARIILGDITPVVSWSGGDAGMASCDFTPLKGRKVVIWPDNDASGVVAADKCGLMLLEKKIAKGVKIVIPPAKSPPHWDLADALKEGRKAENIIGYLKKNLRDPEKPIVIPENPELEIKEAKEKGLQNRFNPAIYPFRPLGFDVNRSYYLPDGGQQIVSLRYDQHDENHMCPLLASRDFWEKYWTTTRKKRNDETGEYEETRSKIDWKGAKDFIITQMQHPYGIFRGGDSIRRQGVWRDNNRIVVHLGERFMVDAVETKITEFKTNYIYERCQSKEIETYQPLPCSEALKLIEILEKFIWVRTRSPRMIAGWVVAALIGGALPWRPHLWINGPQSCGKSSILKVVLKSIFGNCLAAFVEGATTEAGLRQAVNHCSLPILFDEAESTDLKSQIRIDLILDLMRSSASPDGGKMLKGTPGGESQSYDVQSCFCLASVTNNIKLAADASRIVNIEMKAHDERMAETWEVLKPEILNTFNPEWAGKFRSRVFGMIPVARKNIDIFTKVIRDEIKNQRVGDVFGVILGCAHCLYSDDVAAIDTAKEWVKEIDWSEEAGKKTDKDEINCLTNILTKSINVGIKGVQQKRIWDLIKISCFGAPTQLALDFESPIQLIAPEAAEVCKRFGIMYRFEDHQRWVYIANRNINLEKELRDANMFNWAKQLKRLSEKINGKHYEAQSASPLYFSTDLPVSRATKIPWEICALCMDEDESDGAPPQQVMKY